MSLSGSAAEGYGKTGDGMLRHNDGVPPEPTAENPAGVAPQVSSTSAPTGSIPGTGTADDGDLRHVFGNPILFNDTFGQLSTAFSSTLAVVEGELPSGLGSKAKDLIERLKAMRAEIDGWREGKPLEGGSKKEETNDVSRESGEQSGGLYAD